MRFDVIILGVARLSLGPSTLTLQRRSASSEGRTVTQSSDIRQEIETLASAYGFAYPGSTLGLDLASALRANLPVLTSSFGLLAFAYLGGEVKFPTADDERAVLIAMQVLMNICSTVGITQDEWSDATAEVTNGPGPSSDGFDA